MQCQSRGLLRQDARNKDLYFNISEMKLSNTLLFSVQIISYLGASYMIYSDVVDSFIFQRYWSTNPLRPGAKDPGQWDSHQPASATTQPIKTNSLYCRIEQALSLLYSSNRLNLTQSNHPSCTICRRRERREVVSNPLLKLHVEGLQPEPPPPPPHNLVLAPHSRFSLGSPRLIVRK